MKGHRINDNHKFSDSIILDTFLKIPDRGVLVLCPKGSVLEANEFFLQICSCTPHEIFGKSFIKYLEKTEKNNPIIDSVQKTIFEKNPGEFQVYSNQNSKHINLAELKITPVKTEDGSDKIIVIYDLIEDYHDIQQLEGLRLAYNTHLRKLQNIRLTSYQLNGVCIIDKQGVFTYVNEKYCDVSGYSKQELIGINHSILNTDFNTSEFYQSVEDVVKKGETWSGVVKNLSKSKKYYWLNEVISPFFNSKGELLYFICVSTEITEQIKAAELLNKQNEILKEYAFINSHHIRGPLSNILGVVNMLKEDKSYKDCEFVYDIESSAGELDLVIKLLNNTIQGNKIKLDYFSDDIEYKFTPSNVWLIDDDRIQHKLNAKLIKNHNDSIAIKSFINSSSALEEIIENNFNPDLIFLDINMPEVNGFEFMEKLSTAKKSVKIVLLTSSIDIRDMVEASKYPFVKSFINKPLTKEKLERVID